MQKMWGVVRDVCGVMGLVVEEYYEHKIVVRGVEKVIIHSHGTARLETGAPKVTNWLAALNVAAGSVRFEDL
jgi:hypothetical protein